MKKSFFGIVTIMLLLAIVLPLSVNAATLSVDKSEMNVGDIVTVEVTTDQDVESIQFDLQFDRSKYEYVNDSAESDLDATDSNLIADNMVRVSAFDMNQEKADTVTMKFKAIAGGTSVPFKVVGTVEIGENGEVFDAPEVQIKQIKGENTEVANSTQYVDGKGQVITRLPQTGDKNPIRIYGQLVTSENVVAYALPYSDDTLSISDLKAQFGTQIVITGNDNDIVGTGKEFTLNGNTYTVVIYGDVNGDGKVTTADALRTRKSEEGKVTTDSFEKEALDVVKTPGKDNGEHTANALAQQAFILRKQYGTQEQTIIDVYPEEAGDLINGISGNEQTPNNKYRYEDIAVADISSTIGNDALTQDILTYELKLNGAIVDKDSKTAEVTYTNNGNGNFTVELYAAKAGNYEVTPIIAGTNVEGGVQKGNTYSVEVAEKYDITDIKIKEGSTEITGNVQVRVGKQKELNVEFVHEYTNVKAGYTAPEPFVITDVDSNKVNVTADSNYFATETAFANNVLTVKPQSQVGNTTITLAMDNATKTINVDILAEARIAGITLNETKLTDTVTSTGAINIYRDTNYVASDKTVKKVEKIKDSEDVLRDSIFTILPIALVDEDGDIINTMKRKDVTIFETEDELSSADFYFKYYALNDNNEYVEKDNDEDRIDAIGIALNLELVEGWLEYVNTGLTIEYSTLTGTKSATIPVKVFEKGVEVTTEDSSEDEPTNQDEPSQAPTTPDANDNNSANAGNVNGEPVEDKNQNPSTSVKPQEPSDDNENSEDADKGTNPDDNNNTSDNNNVDDNPENSARPQPSPDDTEGPADEDNNGSVVEE